MALAGDFETRLISTQSEARAATEEAATRRAETDELRIRLKQSFIQEGSTPGPPSPVSSQQHPFEAKGGAHAVAGAEGSAQLVSAAQAEAAVISLESKDRLLAEAQAEVIAAKAEASAAVAARDAVVLALNRRESAVAALQAQVREAVVAAAEGSEQLRVSSGEVAVLRESLATVEGRLTVGLRVLCRV